MRVLVTESERFSLRARKLLESIGTVIEADLSGPEMRKAISESDCEILWVRLRNRIGEDVLSVAPRLKWIVSATTGLNHIDLEAAARRGVRVLSLKGEVEFLKHIRATAELTIALMLALIRKLVPATLSVTKNAWDRDAFRGYELYEQQVGLIGFGRLGRIVASYLGAFGSYVCVHDPGVKSKPVADVTWLPLEDLLVTCPLVSLHASYEPGNEKFFNADCFSLMPRHSWFVNTARGELVDEEALLAALESGRLAGAALDVLSGETGLDPCRHRLIEFARRSDRLILTPHIGGCTHESMERTEAFLAGKLKETLQCAGS